MSTYRVQPDQLAIAKALWDLGFDTVDIARRISANETDWQRVVGEADVANSLAALREELRKKVGLNETHTNL